MTWVPLVEGEVNPLVDDLVVEKARVFSNDRYEVIARDKPANTPDVGAMTWLSIKRKDRRPEIPWRHLQQIKNEVCGTDREGVEIFPVEERLADSANERHLWVFPVGIQLPFGFEEGLVTNDEQVDTFNRQREAGMHKGRQEPWEPGLTTGRNDKTRYMRPEEAEIVKRISAGQPSSGDLAAAERASEAAQRQAVEDLF